MDAFDEIKAYLEKKTDDLARDVLALKEELEAKLADAKNNEILSAIRNLNTRLEKIEARLPEPEEDI